MSILSGRGLCKAYGPQTLFSNLSLTIRAGEKVGLLGVNGTGKSTLLRVLAGLEPVDEGVIDRAREAKIVFLSQEPELRDDATPRQIVEEGLAEWSVARARHTEVSRLLEAGSIDHDLVTEQAHLGETIDRLGGWSRDHVAEGVLGKLGVRELDRPVGSMSGGERRRVALARVLVEKPDLAILDEPTNHLDADTIEWLEEYLVSEFEGAVFLVTHDRYVLDAIADRVLELENGQLVEYEGNYGDYLEQKAERMEQAARSEDKRMNFIRRERAWLMRGAKARTTKQKARIQRAEAAIAVEGPRAAGQVKLEAQVTRLGKTILELDRLGCDVAGRTLFDGLTWNMCAGDRVCVLGPNGAGKTTLLRVVSGEIAPTRGRVVQGARTRYAYFDQARAGLVDEWSVFDNVAGREGAERSGGGMVEVGDRSIEMRTYLEQLLFDGSKQRQKVGSLSGGERARVVLAKTLRTGANVLLLDEPTNDLDVATLGALEELLENWTGCVLAVSHDRWFINRVATAVLVFDAGPTPTLYQGNYETYRSLRPDPVTAAAAAAAATARLSAPPPSREIEAPKQERQKPLTYAERIELETILDRVASAETKAADLERQLADPALYTASSSSAEKSRTLRAQFEAAQAEVVRLMARWEDLESRKGAKG